MPLEQSPTRKAVVWAVVGLSIAALLWAGTNPEYGGDLVVIFTPGILLGLVVATIFHFTSRDILPAREDVRGGWGWNISRINFSGAGGLIFAVGSMAVLFAGVPELRWFLALSLPLGILVGAVLHLVHRFSGAGGLLFAAVSMAALFAGVPPLRWFLALSLPLGIAVWVVLHMVHHD